MGIEVSIKVGYGVKLSAESVKALCKKAGVDTDRLYELEYVYDLEERGAWLKDFPEVRAVEVAPYDEEPGLYVVVNPYSMAVGSVDCAATLGDLGGGKDTLEKFLQHYGLEGEGDPGVLLIQSVF